MIYIGANNQLKAPSVGKMYYGIRQFWGPLFEVEPSAQLEILPCWLA